jgi:PAS domain S-box-containing protein
VFRENHYLQALPCCLDLQSVVDRNYRYRYVNQVYLEYWQKRRDQIEGHTVAELVGEELFNKLAKESIDRALAGEPVMVDDCIHYPGLGRRYVRINHLPARDRHGNIIGVAMRIEDITDLKEVEMSLRHTVRLLEEKKLDLQRFIYILSHDLREPVNTILNFSDLLREQLLKAERAGADS